MTPVRPVLKQGREELAVHAADFFSLQHGHQAWH